jgi:hypothetical protein
LNTLKEETGIELNDAINDWNSAIGNLWSYYGRIGYLLWR